MIPQWRFVQLLGRNPLVRTSDRLEALVLLLAIVVSLLTIPIAAAIGTGVYDGRRHVYAEQEQSRRMVTATVIADDSAGRHPLSTQKTVRARWVDDGIERAGTIKVGHPVNVAETVDIWLDEDGSQVGPPIRSAADEGVAAAFATWWSVTIAAAGVVAGVRALLNRARNIRWQRDFDNLVASSDGRTGAP